MINGTHLISFKPAERPGKHLGTADVQFGDNLTIAIPVSFTGNRIAIGTPSRHRIKADIRILDNLIHDVELQFPADMYDEFASDVLHQLSQWGCARGSKS